MLSIPFPTVSDVVFNCQVLRRASPQNCPKSLGLRTERKASWQSKKTNENASECFLSETHTITMSRLADISDLRGKLHEKCGIPLNCLRFFMQNEDDDNEEGSSEFIEMMKMSALPEKEGPCLQFARQSPTGEFVSPSELPTTIIVFELTLNRRPLNSETQDAEYDLASKDKTYLRHKAADALKSYGDGNECRVFDTDPTLLARAMSRCLWPGSYEAIVPGLRVDAIDHLGHWFPGSVVDVACGLDEMNSKTPLQNRKIIKVHFDNFSSKWDLMYSFADFAKGDVKPVYSHSRPKEKPIEFQVFHSEIDNDDALFGHPFFIQCFAEWSVSRAGAHILAQAARFLEKTTFGKIDMKDIEMNKIYRESRLAISRAIDLLVEADRNYVKAAFSKDVDNVVFDGSSIIKNLEEKLSTILPKVPFELFICDTKETDQDDVEENVKYAYRLDQTIGNHMNARHGVVLRWKKLGRSREATLYNNPFSTAMEQNQPASKTNQSDDDLIGEKPKYSNGGMPLGVCLDEFCKEQNLGKEDCWRCPKCKDFREGRQSMSVWRLPELLTFHLKRFNCTARWREKITTKIHFPLTGLDMKEWCDKSSPHCSETDCIYDLVGVVNHYGGMTGGHYVATCKVSACSPEGSEEVEHNFNGAGVHAFGLKEKAAQTTTWKLGRNKEKDSTSVHTRAAISAAKTAAESSEPLWLQFDDDSVEPIPPRSVNTQSAYVLFYRRRQISPSNIARYSTVD